MTEACPPATSGRAFSLNCDTEFDTLGKHSAACRDAGGAVWDRLSTSGKTIIIQYSTMASTICGGFGWALL